MYIYEQEDVELDVKSELKKIAQGLGYSYIEKNPVVNTNGVHTGIIKVGQVVINILYKKYINSITITLEDINIDCTNGIKEVTDLSVDLQTVSMVIKSIHDSDLMD